MLKEKTMKKLLSILMCAILCATACTSFVACDPDDNGGGTTTEVVIVIGAGGLGRAFVDNAVARFTEEVKGTSYEEGKTGVTFKVITDGYGGNLDAQESNGYHIYYTSSSEANIPARVRKGQIANINDVVTEKFENVNGVDVSIEDKMSKVLRKQLQGDVELDGTKNYYAVPLHTYSAGLTLDENSANRNGFFFHIDQTGESGGEKFTSQLLNKDFYFVEGTGGEGGVAPENKSLGPDLQPGTQDDGLPRSMNELVAYCEYIKWNNKFPFICSGMYANMHFFMIQGLVNSLLGFDHARAFFDFEAEDFEVVTGFSNEQLWPGFKTAYEGKCKDYSILKPITTKVDITPETGYYTTWSSAMYYAEAFTDLAYKMDWFAPASFLTTHDQRQAMSDFYLSGFDANVEESVMLVEMDFWPNESKLSYIPESYDDLYNHDNHIPRQHLWMSLPTVFYSDNEPGAEEGQEEKTKQTVQEAETSVYVVAKMTERYPGVFQACKDFLQFVSTNEEGDLHTLEVGLKKPYDYNVSDETFMKIPYFFGKLAELKELNQDLVYEFSESEIYRANPELNSAGYWGDRWTTTVKIDGKVNRMDVTAYLRDYSSKADVMEAFTNGVYYEGTPYANAYFRLKEQWSFVNTPGVAYYEGTNTPVVFQKKAK